ncbi:hypothetical protein U1Q18_027069 [Sarracenia purpurea var. burkii]
MCDYNRVPENSIEKEIHSTWDHTSGDENSKVAAMELVAMPEASKGARFPLSPTQCLPYYVADPQQQSAGGPTIGGADSSLRRWRIKNPRWKEAYGEREAAQISRVVGLCLTPALDLVPDLNVESNSVGHQDDLNDLKSLREMALERTSHAR